ncbi:MAG: atpH [Candidatus Saccharibacteria bacterium]|nr:atpH [Candidatus Saccharibacteria bacterium]
MKFSLPPTIASVQDITALIAEIHDYSVWLNHQALKQRVGKKSTSYGPTMSPAADNLILQWIGKHEPDSASMDALAASLEHYRQTAQSVTITLAAPASVSIKTELVGWFRKHLNSELIVNFQFNSTILGGMVIRYGSRVFDWSFRRQLLADRAKFPEVLRHV